MTMGSTLSHGLFGHHASFSGHVDHDACGTGFVAHLSGAATHEVWTVRWVRCSAFRIAEESMLMARAVTAQAFSRPRL
jgi:hypothetical protein